MAIRDLSPSSYVAPGTARLALSVILSANGLDPLPLDVLLSNYSPSADVYYNFAGSATMVALSTIIPGLDANARVIVVVPPRGNTNAMTLKGVTGDTGVPLNPNGITVIPIPSGGAPTWGLTVTVATTGVRFIVL